MSDQTRILVVEDEGVVAKDLQTRLRKLGYDVPVTVQTGEDAIVAARKHQPDLILMDVRLKGKMDGVEASGIIMEEFRTPVIFLTAYADDGTLGRAKLTEPYGFILKPFNERELHTAIQVALHRHLGERALRKSERWFAGTLRSIGDAIIAVNNDMNVLFMNAVAIKLTQWTEKEAIGQSLFRIYRLLDAVTGQEQDEATAKLYDPKGMAAQNGSHAIRAREAVLVRQDNTRVPIEDSSAPILDDSGESVGAVLVFRDITTRKEAEAAHRDNEEQLRSLANSISQLAWMAQPNGEIFWYNDRWYKYTGGTPEDMLGSGWQNALSSETRLEVVQRWEQSLASGDPFDMEFPLRSAAGQYRWFLTRATPVTDAQGVVKRWFGTNTDIHEGREIREQLQRANSNLAQFAYSASHDLREPLRNVRVFSSLLGQRYSEVLDSAGAEYLGYITEGAARMESLVTDLLAYAESGQPLEREFEASDANSIFRSVLSGLKTAIAECDAEIICRELPTVKIRSVHLDQLLQNLISNALKYRSHRKPVIEISASHSDAEWTFAVKDNGIGINPEYRENVFGLFKRLHSSAEYKGTGLGLALCRNVIRQYGGRIWVESTLGEGATFFFSLPR